MNMNIDTLCINCKKNSSCTMCWKTSDKKCPHFIQMTNADRIRSVSDEKLALFVRAIISAESCPGIYCDCDECFFKEPCFNDSKWRGKEMEWLQQLFEGE